MTYARDNQEPASKPDVRRCSCRESLQKGFACDSWHCAYLASHSLKHVPEAHNRACIKRLCIVSHTRAIIHTLCTGQSFLVCARGVHTFFQARCIPSRIARDRERQALNHRVNSYLRGPYASRLRSGAALSGDSRKDVNNFARGGRPSHHSLCITQHHTDTAFLGNSVRIDPRAAPPSGLICILQDVPVPLRTI